VAYLGGHGPGNSGSRPALLAAHDDRPVNARAGLALAAALLAACPARAQPQIPRAERPGLGATEARRPVDMAQAPWRSLGRVQTELGARCTGTLVAPDRVLTAAHCLVAPTGQLLQPRSVHFLLGYDAGRFAAHGRAAALEIAPGYEPARRGPFGADWALLRLETPLPGPVLPLRPATLGLPVALGGYQQDRAEKLMADLDCPLRGLVPDGTRLLLRHGCAGTRGASGAALLQRSPDGDWQIIGVAVGAIRHEAGGVAVPAQAIGW
jgi:protease YdgD